MRHIHYKHTRGILHPMCHVIMAIYYEMKIALEPEVSPCTCRRLIITSRVSVEVIELEPCFCVSVRPTLCTISWVQGYIVHHRLVLCTTGLRCASWCTRGIYVIIRWCTRRFCMFVHDGAQYDVVSLAVCPQSHGRTVRPMTLIFGMGVDLDVSRDCRS